MATALTATIDGAYTAPAVINVHFLDDGSGTGWENQGTLTDATGHTFGYDGWTPYEQQQANWPSPSSPRSPTWSSTSSPTSRTPTS
jgi:hypothetical protein